MAIDVFKENFINTYQDIFLKVTVAMKIANTRLEAGLSYGKTVNRVKYDLSAVRVRTVTIGSDRTVDSVTDTAQLLTVDKIRGTTFAISDYEKIQAGPLNPGSVFGGKAAEKLAIYVDADVLAETVNAFATFDTGNLTTYTANGTPIALNSTTVPQLISRMPAKLGSNNISLNNLCWVVDSYTASDLTQYMLGKNIDMAGKTFQNGYSGTVSNADVYVSENLTGQAVLTMSTNIANTETITINGVVFTAVTSIGATAGNFLIGANTAATLTTLAAFINDPGTTNANQVALSSADQVKMTDTYRIAATAGATTLTIVGTGSGKLTVSETAANSAWGTPYVHSYFGKKGAIDVVIQDQVDMLMRDEPKQRSTNVMADALYGIKTFDDGAQQFIDVLIA